MWDCSFSSTQREAFYWRTKQIIMPHCIERFFHVGYLATWLNFAQHLIKTSSIDSAHCWFLCWCRYYDHAAITGGLESVPSRASEWNWKRADGIEGWWWMGESEMHWEGGVGRWEVKIIKRSEERRKKCLRYVGGDSSYQLCSGKCQFYWTKTHALRSLFLVYIRTHVMYSYSNWNGFSM